MTENEYYIAWPEAIDIDVNIEWSQPYTHEVLFSELAPEDETAYLYSIVAKFEKEWTPLYIGMVYDQSVSERHKSEDHKARMDLLKQRYKDKLFYVTLGTPSFKKGRISSSAIKAIEQLLTYCNWSDKMINEKNIEYCAISSQVRILNKGFIEHVCEETAYGVFYRGA